MKAFVKVNVSMHLVDDSVGLSKEDSTRLNETIRYPLAENHAGVCSVADKADAERVMGLIGRQVEGVFTQLAITKQKGTHVPKLEAAFGGDPEPKTEAN